MNTGSPAPFYRTMNATQMDQDKSSIPQTVFNTRLRPSHVLCEHCTAIADGRCKHYLTRDELEQSSRQGCHLCTHLIHCHVPIKKGLSWEPGRITHSTTTGVPLVEGTINTIRTNDPTELAEPHPSATNACFTGSEDVLALAKQWLDECRTHSQCQELKWTSALQPPRVIDVHSRQIVSADGEYVALSYVWGEKRTQLDMGALPATFEHAMFVTKYLGIRYLWIDALCIADFDEESKMMAQIYGNAVVTLTASSSDGMFVHRDPLRHLPCRVGSMRYGPGVDTIKTRQETVENAKISSRGWCFQERLLSRRVLHFTDRGLVWECCTMEATDMHPLGRLLLSNASDVTRSLRVPLMRVGLEGSSDEIADLDDEETRSPFKRSYHASRMRAHQLTQIYSSRDLTFKDDRLSAFQGILSALSATGLRNAHGILTQDHESRPSWVPADAGHQMSLLWHTEANGRPLPPRTRGPSWSWTSVDSIISWHRDRVRDRGARRINIMQEAFEGGLTLRADQSWQCTKAQIISTLPLNIRGRPLRMTVGQAIADGACLDNAGRGDEDPWVWPDSAQMADLSPDDSIAFLPMLWSDGDSPGVKGLILKDEQRIGLFVLGGMDKQRTRRWQRRMLDAPEEDVFVS